MRSKGTRSAQSQAARTSAGTRSRLLTAALAIFAECGYQAATTRVICKRAYANAAALNYHFGNKRKLYCAVLSLCMQDEVCWTRTSVERVGAKRAFRQVVKDIIMRLLAKDMAQNNTRLLIHELLNPSSEFKEVVEQILRPWIEDVTSCIASIADWPVNAKKTRMAKIGVFAQIVYFIRARDVIAPLWRASGLDGSATTLSNHISEFTLASFRDMR